MTLQELLAAPVCSDRFDHISKVCGQYVRNGSPGLVLEFGVFRGESLCWLTELLKDKSIAGFDSFDGLPEDWVVGVSPEGKRNVHPTGTYRAGKQDVLKLPPTVELVDGLFQDSLPPFLRRVPGDVGLLHMDADLYSSTICVLSLLNDRIRPGCLIAFDELFDTDPRGYTEWQEHEWKALHEWMDKFGRRVRPLFRTSRMQASVLVVE